MKFQIDIYISDDAPDPNAVLQSIIDYVKNNRYVQDWKTRRLEPITPH